MNPPDKIVDCECPCCKREKLISVRLSDGSHTAGSATMIEDEDGRYVICPGCQKHIYLEQDVRDVWILARQQDCK